MLLQPVLNLPLVRSPVAPVTMNVSPGTVDAGTVADVAEFGGTNVDIGEESASTPGFLVEFVFSGLETVRGFQYRVQYVGSAPHTVELEVYNYIATDWDFVRRIYNRTSMETGSIRVDPRAYWSAGAALLRFNHTSQGVGTHYLLIDFIGAETA